MKINFILTGEGSSDLRMITHIEYILLSEGFEQVKGEAPDFGFFKDTVGRSVKDKLKTIARHYPSTDLVFIHRDGDNAGIEDREIEISNAASEINEFQKEVIPLIPLRMIETWLLTDQALINTIAGRRDTSKSINCIPSIKKLESTPDTKSILMNALCEASEITGGRLNEFKKRFPAMRARIMENLEIDGNINRLSAYVKFRERIRKFSQNKLNPLGMQR